MKEIYYLSGEGRKKLYLDRVPYWMQTGDFMDYQWDYTARNRRITGFSKDVQEHDLTISVFGNTAEEYEANLQQMHDIFEATDQLVLNLGYDAGNLRDQARRRVSRDAAADYSGRSLPRRAHGTENLPRFTSSSELILLSLIHI